MGLPAGFLRFLAREHRRKAFSGSVLTLGRPCVYATPQQVAAMFQEEGVTPRRPLDELPATSNIPAWRGTPYEAFLSDVAFFQALGADQVQALDYSDFEGAEHVADLNRPISAELHERFDLVVDAGTLEHVFHVPQALANIGQLLKPGGRAIHLTPANNFTNHGFYQISPTLYADYYRQNGYAEVRCFVVEHRTEKIEFAPMRLYELDVRRQPCLLVSPRMLQSLCVAEKQADSTTDRIPLQSYYAQLFGGADPQAHDAPAPPPTLWRRLKALLPNRLKHAIRCHVLRLHHHKRPWGLARRGTLD